MEPKFQSSFIPKGSIASSAPTYAAAPVTRRRQGNAFSFIANTIFTLSLLFALGVFGYKFFLNNRIAQMGAELESARAAIEPETVNELIRMDARLVSTAKLIDKHQIVSPLFDFLETATPKSVRYTHFSFNTTNKGLELKLQGQATSYGALAAAADVFNRAKNNFLNPSFSDLALDQRGNVSFTLTTLVDPEMLSYEQLISSNPVDIPALNSTSSATTTPGTNPPRR